MATTWVWRVWNEVFECSVTNLIPDKSLISLTFVHPLWFFFVQSVDACLLHIFQSAVQWYLFAKSFKFAPVLPPFLFAWGVGLLVKCLLAVLSCLSSTRSQLSAQLGMLNIPWFPCGICLSWVLSNWNLPVMPFLWVTSWYLRPETISLFTCRDTDLTNLVRFNNNTFYL